MWSYKTNHGLTFKVGSFWETLKIWKNLSHGVDKSADLLVNIKTMREIFSNYVCFSKSPNFKMHWDRYVLILAFLNRNWLRSQLWAMTHCHQPMLLMRILATSQTVQIWRIQAFWECFSDLSCPILIQTILIHHNKMKGKSTIYCNRFFWNNFLFIWKHFKIFVKIFGYLETFYSNLQVFSNIFLKVS